MLYQNCIIACLILLCMVIPLNYSIPLTKSSSSKISSKGYLPVDISNPNQSPNECGRSEVPKSAICDPSLLLTTEQKNIIEGYINDFPNQLQIGILIISKMSSTFIGFSSIELSSERFARIVHDRWKIGDSQTNNGILIFLSIEDRSVYISTGSGAKKIISNDDIAYLIDHMKPYLRQKNYHEALEHVILELKLIVTNQPSVNRSKYVPMNPHDTSGHNNLSSSSNSSMDYLGLVVFFGIFAVAMINHYYQRRRHQQLEIGQIALKKLMKEMNECYDQNQFHSTTCPICFEEFPVESNSMSSSSMTDPIDSNDVNDITKDISDDNGSVDSIGSDNSLKQRKSHRSKDNDDVETTFANSSKENGVMNLGGNETLGEEKRKLESKKGMKDEDLSESTSMLSPHRPMALQCGHIFCYDCLSNYLKTGVTCPICRAPVDKNQQPPQLRPSHPTHPSRPFTSNDETRDDPTSCSNTSTSSTAAPTANPTSTSTAAPTAWFMRRPEFHYRLYRARALYPDLITAEFLGAMTRSIDHGSIVTMRSLAESRRTEVQRMIHNETTRANAARSGSHGSSMSFGGGSSRGGGGGGGRW